MDKIDRSHIKRGMFLKGGEFPGRIVGAEALELEAADEKFDEAARLHDLLDKTKRALAALKAKI